MKTKRLILCLFIGLGVGLCLGLGQYLHLSAGNDAQASDADAAAAAAALQDGMIADQKRWIENDHKQAVLAAEREKSVSALRADLASPWTSLIIAHRYDCSCTGTSYTGIRISRAGASVTVMAWGEGRDGAMTRGSRPMTLPELERLLSETALFYLAAALSVSPHEKAGPYPADPMKAMEWRQRYLAAGGSPMASDHYWIDVRAETPEGLKRHSNMWDRYCPSDFSNWIIACRTPPSPR